jgi:retron-type reverse transcriptase
VKIFLKSTYLSYKGNIYEKIHGVAIGSPLSPIVANIYMEKFEVRDLNSFPLTLGVWK